MIHYRPSDIVLARIDDGIEFFTLLKSGHLILRHRLPSGVLCEHVQHYTDLHPKVRQLGVAAQVELVPLPESLHKDFTVPFVAGLRHADSEAWGVLFPLMPCTPDKVLKLISEGPETYMVGFSGQFAISPDHLDERRLSAFGPTSG